MIDIHIHHLREDISLYIRSPNSENLFNVSCFIPLLEETISSIIIGFPRIQFV
jgi:hypothetical protein